MSVCLMSGLLLTVKHGSQRTKYSLVILKLAIEGRRCPTCSYARYLVYDLKKNPEIFQPKSIDHATSAQSIHYLRVLSSLSLSCLAAL
jgi:hypothetical protein